MREAEFNRFVDAQRWIFAKTMPQIPHWYCLRRDADDQTAFNSAVRHIREAGYDGTWRGTTRRYLDHGGYVYWTMGAPIAETILINRQRLADSEVVRPGETAEAPTAAGATSRFDVPVADDRASRVAAVANGASLGSGEGQQDHRALTGTPTS